MKNFEVYEDDLMKIEGQFAFDKSRRRVVRCGAKEGGISCEECLFHDMEYCFGSDKIKWLYEEYKPPILSDDELELINVLSKINGKDYKYIVRDADGVIRLFEIKPLTNKTGYYYSEYGYTYIDSASGDKVLFPNIQYKDGIYDITERYFIEE